MSKFSELDIDIQNKIESAQNNEDLVIIYDILISKGALSKYYLDLLIDKHNEVVYNKQK